MSAIVDLTTVMLTLIPIMCSRELKLCAKGSTEYFSVLSVLILVSYGNMRSPSETEKNHCLDKESRRSIGQIRFRNKYLSPCHLRQERQAFLFVSEQGSQT